jgi:hypothetical protein
MYLYGFGKLRGQSVDAPESHAVELTHAKSRTMNGARKKEMGYG